MNAGCLSVAVDHDDSVRIFPSESQKPVSYPLVEVRSLGLEAIGVRFSAPALGTREPDPDRTIEYEGEVGPEPLPADGLDRANFGERKPAPERLVREGRVREAIAKNDPSRVDGRPDHAVYVLGAVRENQEELGEPSDLDLGVEQQLTYGAPEPGASRFACDHHGPARRLDRRGE